MLAYLKRLVTTGAAYQAGDIVSKALAIFTLPLYTRYVSTSQYGYAETLLTQVILISILLRLGVGEAFVRFWFDDDDARRRERMTSTTVIFVAISTTVAGLIGVAYAGPLSQLQLGVRKPDLALCAVLGLWAFTNLEIAYSLLRVEERAKAYIITSVSNVGISIALTIYLVVFRHDGAEGLLLGNFAGSTAVLLALWWIERRRIFAPLRAGAAAARKPLRRMLGFGLPTVPADASVYALQVIDRAYLLRADSPAAAGLYAVAAKIATVVFVAVRGFQYAWPPLAYSVTDDDEAARLYSLVTTYYLLATGVVVAGVALLGRWALLILAAPKYVSANAALPWLALGWALYGLYLVFVVIAGRSRAMARNLPAAGAGLVVNVIGIVVLVPSLGIAGAGIALCVAYAAMLVVIYTLTRRVFSVGFEWGRLTRLVVVLGGVGVAGDLLLPDAGVGGFASRAAAFLVLGPLLAATGFFRPNEWDRATALLAGLRARVSG